MEAAQDVTNCQVVRTAARLLCETRVHRRCRGFLCSLPLQVHTWLADAKRSTWSRGDYNAAGLSGSCAIEQADMPLRL